MLMADTMSIFFVILGMMLAFPALWLFCRGLWPEAVNAAADRCGKRLWSSFLAGLPITIVMIMVVQMVFNLFGPVGKIASVGVVCLYVLQANTGVSGVARLVRYSAGFDHHRLWRRQSRLAK